MTTMSAATYTWNGETIEMETMGAPEFGGLNNTGTAWWAVQLDVRPESGGSYHAEVLVAERDGAITGDEIEWSDRWMDDLEHEAGDAMRALAAEAVAAR